VSERPTAQELTEAILEFLGGEILPTIEDRRLRFRTLVAMNALSIVYRELERMPAEDDAEQRELARRIRSGDVPPGTLARVKREVAERLRIASPRYLETYD
jgi:signal transduction protein with GAF and PtsI domain